MAISKKMEQVIRNATKSDLIEMSASLLEAPMMGGFEKRWQDRLECLSVMRMIDLNIQSPTGSRTKQIKDEMERLEKEGVIE